MPSTKSKKSYGGLVSSQRPTEGTFSGRGPPVGRSSPSQVSKLMPVQAASEDSLLGRQWTSKGEAVRI
jgi:hypothetical protein